MQKRYIYFLISTLTFISGITDSPFYRTSESDSILKRNAALVGLKIYHSDIITGVIPVFRNIEGAYRLGEEYQREIIGTTSQNVVDLKIKDKVIIGLKISKRKYRGDNAISSLQLYWKTWKTGRLVGAIEESQIIGRATRSGIEKNMVPPGSVAAGYASSKTVISTKKAYLTYLKLRVSSLPRVVNGSIAFESADPHCMTEDEEKLINMINRYRRSKGLSEPSPSKALQKVARLHALDSALYGVSYITRECNGHSWSKNGNWEGCCYSPNHKNWKCMQEKPAELTSYKKRGYEIGALLGQNARPESMLSGWKRSPQHNAAIIESGAFKNSNWMSIGAGIVQGTAFVWFGKEADPGGKAKRCK